MSKTTTKAKKAPTRGKESAEPVRVEQAKLSDLVPDDKNFNRGTQFGQHLIEKSLRELGAGRSILLDKNNRIIAGNKTTENAAAIDMEDVIIVESDGSKLVAVKRTDIDLDSEQGRQLALADNATSAANLDWDEDELQRMQQELDNFNPEDWGVTFPEESEEEEKKQEAKEKFVDDWFINIECTGEQQCQELYDEFLKRGILCKIIH